MTDPVPAVTDGDARRRSRRTWIPPRLSSPLGAAALVAVAALPIIVVAISRWGRLYVPTADLALIDLRVRDVTRLHDVPLVGAWSWTGWNHPGPILFWLLAIPSAFAGRAAWATQVGGDLVQAAAIAGLGALAWRRGRAPLAAAAMAAVALSYVGVRALSVDMLFEPWNPYVAFPFFALFLFAVLEMIESRRRGLITAVAVGSLLVQADVGYLALVVAALAGALVARRATDREPFVAPAARPLAIVLVVLWLPTILDAVKRWPGSFALWIWYLAGAPKVFGLRAKYPLRYLLGRPPGHLGYGTAARLLAIEYRLPPPWIGGRVDDGAGVFGTPHGASAAWLVVPVVLLGVASWRARAGANRRALAVVVLTAGLNLVALLTIAHAPDPSLSYQFVWRVPLAIFTVLVCTATIGASFQSTAWRSSVVRRSLVVAMCGVLAGASTSTLLAVAHDDRHGFWGSTASAETPRVLARQLLAAGLPRRPVIVVGCSGLANYGATLVDELDRSGRPVYVDRQWAFQYGPSRGRGRSSVSALWVVEADARMVPALLTRPGARVIARAPSRVLRSRRAQEEIATLSRQIAAFAAGRGLRGWDAVLRRGGPFAPLLRTPGAPGAALRRLSTLESSGTIVAGASVVEIPVRDRSAPPTTTCDAA